MLSLTRDVELRMPCSRWIALRTTAGPGTEHGQWLCRQRPPRHHRRLHARARSASCRMRARLSRIQGAGNVRWLRGHVGTTKHMIRNVERRAEEAAAAASHPALPSPTPIPVMAPSREGVGPRGFRESEDHGPRTGDYMSVGRHIRHVAEITTRETKERRHCLNPHEGEATMRR